MRRYYKSYLKENSRKLRGSQTESELILWSRIRRKQLNGIQFNRQKPLGNYIVDFYCPTKKLVIEIDGGQHYENGETILEDNSRDEFLTKILKLTVLRFTNTEVKYQLASVIDKIIEALR